MRKRPLVTQKPLWGHAAPRGAHAARMPHETAQKPGFGRRSRCDLTETDGKNKTICGRQQIFFHRKNSFFYFFIFLGREPRACALEGKNRRPKKSAEKAREKSRGKKPFFPFLEN